MQDAMLHYMRTNFSTQARSGKAVERDGTRSGGGSNAPSGLYPCAPGGANDYVWIMTSRANPEHWSRLCKVMGREELINDPRFATPDERVKNDAELDAIIAEWTQHAHQARGDGSRSAAPAFRPARCSTRWSCMNDQNFEERGIMQVMEHPSYKPFKMPAWPVRVDGKPPRVKASPMLGQHTDDVLTSWLGLSEAEVKALHGEGVV